MALITNADIAFLDYMKVFILVVATKAPKKKLSKVVSVYPHIHIKGKDQHLTQITSK